MDLSFPLAVEMRNKWHPFEVKYFEPKEILARMRMQRLNVHHMSMSICPIVMSLTGIG